MLPQLAGNNDRIKLECRPPPRFIAPGMEGTVVGAAKGNGELVACPAAQRARLQESQMMGVRRPTPAHKAWLRGHELQVLRITVAARFAQRKNAFVDTPGDSIIHALFRPGTYSRASGVIRSGDRHRGGRASGTSLPPGGQLARHGREPDVRCSRLIGGSDLHPSCNGRVVIADAGRGGQEFFSEPLVPKSR